MSAMREPSGETGAGDHPNLAVVTQAGKLLASGFREPDEGLFADDFVFHYFNSRLPELAGDYQGLEGMRDFFARLHQLSEGTFHVRPVSLTPFGDELVAAFATNTLTLGGTELELDALVLWRVYDGQIHEVWDVPAVNSSRTLPEGRSGGPTTSGPGARQ
jgi:ketosteroid isomerase-like protein